MKKVNIVLGLMLLSNAFSVHAIRSINTESVNRSVRASDGASAVMETESYYDEDQPSVDVDEFSYKFTCADWNHRKKSSTFKAYMQGLLDGWNVSLDDVRSDISYKCKNNPNKPLSKTICSFCWW